MNLNDVLELFEQRSEQELEGPLMETLAEQGQNLLEDLMGAVPGDQVEDALPDALGRVFRAIAATAFEVGFREGGDSNTPGRVPPQAVADAAHLLELAAAALSRPEAWAMARGARLDD